MNSRASTSIFKISVRKKNHPPLYFQIFLSFSLHCLFLGDFIFLTVLFHMLLYPIVPIGISSSLEFCPDLILTLSITILLSCVLFFQSHILLFFSSLPHITEVELPVKILRSVFMIAYLKICRHTT